jgi:hypothetical protein
MSSPFPLGLRDPTQTENQRVFHSILMSKSDRLDFRLPLLLCKFTEPATGEQVANGLANEWRLGQLDTFETSNLKLP